MSSDVKALINHYAFVGYYQHIQTVCDEVIKKRGNDSELVFWKAFGLAQEGAFTEAIRTLEQIRNKRDVVVPVSMALIHYHQQEAMVDSAEVESLKTTIREREPRAGEVGLLLAAKFCWHTGNPAKARQLAQKVLDSSPENPRALTVRGWIDLTCERRTRRDREAADRSLQYFENALSVTGTKPELEALMGAARYWTWKKQFDKAVDHLTTVTVHYPWFLPGMAEKAHVLCLKGEWSTALEAADTVLQQDSYDILSLCVTIMYNLTRKSRPKIAANRLSELIDSLDRFEPKNPVLYFKYSQPFARLAGGHQQVLSLTLNLVQHARSLDKMNSEYAAEAGYQQMLMNDHVRAMASFQEAARLDEGNIDAIQGMINCQIMQGKIKDAEGQLEFLALVQQSVGRSAGLAMLDALLAWRSSKSASKQLTFLKETLELHWREVEEATKNQDNVFARFVALNPQLLLTVAKEHLQHCGVEPQDAASAPNPHLTAAVELLSQIVDLVPGLLEGQLLLARTQYLTNDFGAATTTLSSKCLKIDPSSSAAHLLLAQIALQQENFRTAQASLEQAVSHNFEIRNSPVYQLIKARVLEALGDLERALRILEGAMKLPGVKRAAGASGAGAGFGSGSGASSAPPSDSSSPPLSQHDRASIWLKLAELHLKMDQVPEATKLVNDAMHEFTGTPEEVRVLVTNSQIAIKRGDVDAAIHMLGNIPPESSSYAKAQKVKADIYLKHRKDKRMYAKCYKQLVERHPTTESQVMLGDAYLRIQMPEEAIASFEEALKANPSNAALASKIGKALVRTHDYHRAVEYYEAALSHSPNNSTLRSDLTELFCKLKKFDKASALLDVALATNDSQDATSLVVTVKNLMLLAKVHSGMENVQEAIKSLQRSAQAQNDVLSKVRGDPDMLREQRKIAGEISYKLAQLYEKLQEDHKAKMYYNQALKANNTDVTTMLALARLYLRRGELDACQHTCVTLMRIDQGNEGASMMLADLMFRKNESEAAMYHFQQLLEKKPRHYTALAKLITLLKRAGKLEDVPRFLKLAERSSPRAAHDPGLKYCKGLHARYSNDPHEAIKFFNLVRHSGEWGESATENMVEIYLSPENEDMWDSEDRDSGMQEAIKVADRLLRDIPTRPLTVKQQVLECYTLIATKVKGNIDAAQRRLAEILGQDRNSVRALLCLATSLMVQKQTPKARNNLKRIAKMQYQQELADEFVRAWLILADIYIQSGKYDLAQELCKRCLGFDKSCARAWEHMGLIMEKEQSYIDAAEHYQQAWHYQHEASATVGYKLAFNFLKAKRYVDAINVCHKVLKQFPDYPRMRKELLEKARANLRP